MIYPGLLNEVILTFVRSGEVLYVLNSTLMVTKYGEVTDQRFTFFCHQLDSPLLYYAKLIITGHTVKTESVHKITLSK